MGLGTFFKKIGKGAVKVGKKIDNVADLPFVKEAVMMIPVVGGPLSLALHRVDQAEKMFSGPQQGPAKMRHALEMLSQDFEKFGLDNHRIGEAVSLALLLMKNEAQLMEVVGSGKTEAAEKAAAKPKPRTRGRSTS